MIKEMKLNMSWYPNSSGGHSSAWFKGTEVLFSCILALKVSSLLNTPICLSLLGKWRNSVDVAVKTLKQGAMSAEAFLDEAKIMHRYALFICLCKARNYQLSWPWPLTSKNKILAPLTSKNNISNFELKPMSMPKYMVVGPTVQAAERVC